MNSTLKFGLLGGVLLASTILFYTFDLTSSGFFLLWTIAQVAIIIFAIYFGVKEEKKVKHNNSISYRDAIITGLKINFIIALIHSLSMFLYFHYQPDEISKLKQSNIEKAMKDMKELKFEESVIKDHIKFINQDITPFNLAKNNFMIILVLGLVFSLIITAILRKKDEEPIASK